MASVTIVEPVSAQAINDGGVMVVNISGGAFGDEWTVSIEGSSISTRQAADESGNGQVLFTAEYFPGGAASRGPLRVEVAERRKSHGRVGVGVGPPVFDTAVVGR